MGRRRKNYLRTLFLLVFLAGLFLFLFFWFHIEKITVTGCSYYSEKEVTDMVFTSPLDYNSLYLYFKHKFIGTKELPFIQKFTITRVSRKEVKVQVYEKALVGCVKYMNQYIYFDKNGIVLECSGEAMEGLPYVTGVDYQGFTLYEKLKVSDEAIFNRILDISQLVQKYELPLKRIHFSQNDTIMLETDGIKVYLGKREFYDEQVAALSEVLPTAQKEGLKGKIHMENYASGQDIIFLRDEKT